MSSLLKKLEEIEGGALTPYGPETVLVMKERLRNRLAVVEVALVNAVKLNMTPSEFVLRASHLKDPGPVKTYLQSYLPKDSYWLEVTGP
jgi:hypothetical protein